MKKEYKNSDILLYSVKNGRIVVIYDDVDALNNYKNKSNDANSQKYAPVGIFKYSKELEEKILKEMHHISSYKIIKLPGWPQMPRDVNSKEADKIIEERKKYTLYELSYKDEAGEYVYPIQFSGFNKEIIQKIMNEQNRLKQSVNIEEFQKLSEDEKQAIKKKNKDIWKKTLAGALAALMIGGGVRHSDNIKSAVTKMFDNNQTTAEDVVDLKPIPKSKPTPITESQINEFAQKLYDETISKDSFILKYQQEAKVNWSVDLAKALIELENGIYPTSIRALNDQQQQQKMLELIQAILLIGAGNDYIETSCQNVINLGDYVVNPIDKAIINNTIMVSRKVISEDKGEYFAPKIIEDYTSVDVFHKEYTNALNQLLEFEYETLNSEEFKNSSNGVRATVTSLFRCINDRIPQYAHVHIESPELSQTNYEMYYRYFVDDSNGNIFYPVKQRVINNKVEENQEEYILTDKNGKQLEDKIYTRSEMYAMADLVDYYQDIYTKRDTGIKPTEGIHQYGLEVEVGKSYNASLAELLNKKYDSSKSWDGLLDFEEQPEVVEIQTSESTHKKENNRTATVAAIAALAAGSGIITYNKEARKKEKDEEVKTR